MGLRTVKDEKTVFAEAQHLFAPVPHRKNIVLTLCWVVLFSSLIKPIRSRASQCSQIPLSMFSGQDIFRTESRIYMAEGKDFFFFFIRRADKAPQWYSKLNCFSVLIKSFPLKLITSHIMVVLSNKIKQWP